MSIRLRFTLLYNAILAITLFALGISLYSIQANNTLNSIKKELLRSSETLGESVLRTITHESLPESSSINGEEPGSFNGWESGTTPEGLVPQTNPPVPRPQNLYPPPKPFSSFSDDQAFKYLPEREIARVLDVSGYLVASPYGRKEDALPIGAKALEELQTGNSVWETGTAHGLEMLIYNRPILQDGEPRFILQVARSLVERNHSLLSLRNTLLLASLITLMIAFAIGWLFSGITFKPIAKITKTTRMIGDERDFSKRVDYQGPNDEVGELAGTINSMLSKLQEAYQQVAVTLDKQREFMADVSHELRTPLTTLSGNLGLLAKQPPLPVEEQDDIVNDMVSESDRMIRLVNELLRLAHADAGRSSQNRELTIFPIIEETCRQIQYLDSARKILFSCPGEIQLIGDPDALKQILLILLDNSIKYSSGDIGVDVSESNNGIKIEIIDNGEGISLENLANVFDRFFRVEGDLPATGFGLGLPIAKSLTEGMGGCIEMVSSPGKGSKVILIFPTARTITNVAKTFII